jgi:hypothetical protein
VILSLLLLSVMLRAWKHPLLVLLVVVAALPVPLMSLAVTLVTAVVTALSRTVHRRCGPCLASLAP